MATATGPSPLTDAAKLRESHIEKGVMYQFVKCAPILEHLKIQDIGKRDYRWARVTDNIAAPGYGAIGMGYGTVHTAPEQLSTTMSYFGFQVDVDKREIADKDNFEDPRQFNVRVSTEAEAFFLTNEFVNGNPAVQKLVTVPGGTKQIPVNQIPGLFYALSNTTVSGLATNTLDCAGVDISPAGNSPTNARKFARYLDEGISQTGDGQGTNMAILAPWEVMTALPDVMRQAGMFATTKDSFGRTVKTWGDGGPAFIDTGLKTPAKQQYDSSTSANRVLGWETSGGTRDDSSNYTSILLVDFSTDSLRGVEQYGMDVKDLGLLQTDGVTYRTVVDWSLGLAYLSPRAVFRLYDVKIK